MQAYTGNGLAQRVAEKQVDATALAATMSLLGATRTKAQAKADYSWIGGPIVGGVAALALVCGLGWYIYKKRQGTVAPTAFDAAYVPRPPSASVKYTNGHQEAAGLGPGARSPSVTSVRTPGARRPLGADR